MNAMFRKNESICLTIVVGLLFVAMMVFVYLLLNSIFDAFVASEQYEIMRTWSWLPEIPTFFR